MTKNKLSALCTELNIPVPEGTTAEQLWALLDEYFKTAAVVTLNDALYYMQTDKPTKEYIVEFTLCGYQRIRAESAEAAHEWVEDELCDYGTPYKYEFTKISDWDVIDVREVEDETF